MAHFFNVCAVIAAAIVLSACAAVDQFGGRVSTGNVNSQNALNEEILLNIIRASQYRSLNFLGIAQIAGGQSEQLTTGFPTALFGHVGLAQYSLSNSLQSGVTGSYQANPLVTTPFQSGMIAPTSPKIISWLIGSHPRAVVMFALIDAFKITNRKSNRVGSLLNNPELDELSPLECQKVEKKIEPNGDCNYSQFANLLNVLLGRGLTVELRRSTAKSSVSSASSGTTATPSSDIEGHFCFDPSLADSRYATSAASLTPICGDVSNTDPPVTTTTTTKSTKNGSDIVTVAVKTSGVKTTQNLHFDYVGTGSISLDLVIRSPQQYFSYLGAWVRHPRSFPSYHADNAIRVFDIDQKYVNIIQGAASNCYTSVAYLGVSYCVPVEAQHTALLMDIAETLRNLNVSPSDLNSSFSVRLSP